MALSRAAQSSFNLRDTRRTLAISLKVMYSKILTSSSAGSSTRERGRWSGVSPHSPPRTIRLDIACLCVCGSQRESSSHSPMREQCVRVWGLMSPQSVSFFLLVLWQHVPMLSHLLIYWLYHLFLF